MKNAAHRSSLPDCQEAQKETALGRMFPKARLRSWHDLHRCMQSPKKGFHMVSLFITIMAVAILFDLSCAGRSTTLRVQIGGSKINHMVSVKPFPDPRSLALGIWRSMLCRWVPQKKVCCVQQRKQYATATG